MSTRLWRRILGLLVKPSHKTIEPIPQEIQLGAPLNPQRRIAKVWVEEGCLICQACEMVCPAVFVVEDTSMVRPDASIHFDSQRDAIEEAKEACCVEVIKIEYA